MPEDGDPRHPVWSVHRLILEHQLLEICNIPNPRLSILDVDAAATDVIRGLAQGWDQKTLCKWLTPPVCEPQQRAVFKALASWIFATQGVLSHIYQPVPSRRAVGDVSTDCESMSGLCVSLQLTLNGGRSDLGPSGLSGLDSS